jgi:hypothetical protein
MFDARVFAFRVSYDSLWVTKAVRLDEMGRITLVQTAFFILPPTATWARLIATNFPPQSALR